MKLLNFVSFFSLAMTVAHSVVTTANVQAANKCDECGKPHLDAKRIVGGEPSPSHHYPWMAAVFFRGSFTCGGSIVNEQFILTAAHCITGRSTFILPNWLTYNRLPQEMKVALGLDNISDVKNYNVTLLEVESLIVHPYYETVIFCGTTHNDIALIKLKSKIVFTNIIKPICLPRYGYGYDNREAIVAGWGTIAETSNNASDELREVGLYVLPDESCKSKLGFIQALLHFRPMSMICAYDDNKDSCQGDSGGPLMYEVRDGQVEQIGIVSYGSGCAKENSPGVYTRVSLFVSWIEKNAGIYCPSPTRT